MDIWSRGILRIIMGTMKCLHLIDLIKNWRFTYERLPRDKTCDLRDCSLEKTCVSDGAGASGVVKRLLRTEKGCLLLSSERAGVNGERWQ